MLKVAIRNFNSTETLGINADALKNSAISFAKVNNG